MGLLAVLGPWLARAVAMEHLMEKLEKALAESSGQITLDGWVITKTPHGFSVVSSGSLPPADTSTPPKPASVPASADSSPAPSNSSVKP